MSEMQPGSPAPVPPQTRLLIWVAMVGSVFLYTGLVFFLSSAVEPVALLPVWVFPVLGLVLAWTAVMIHRRLGETAPSRLRSAEIAQERLRRDIVVWAIDEAVAVIGLVAVLTGAPPLHYVGYGVVALVLLLLHRPQ